MRTPAVDIKQVFSFLKTDYGFTLTEKQETNYGVSITYIGNDVKVILTYDYRDVAFYFYLVKGENTLFPNDRDRVNIRSFHELALKNNPSVSFKSLEPSDNNDYLIALYANASVLKEYGDKILRGQEWFN